MLTVTSGKFLRESIGYAMKTIDLRTRNDNTLNILVSYKNHNIDKILLNFWYCFYQRFEFNNLETLILIQAKG